MKKAKYGINASTYFPSKLVGDKIDETYDVDVKTLKINNPDSKTVD